MKNAITISRERVAKKRGVVILDLEEYEELQKRAVPTYYLTGKAAERLDNVVREGLREYERGETIAADSLDEALQIYEKKHQVFKKVSPVGKEASRKHALSSKRERADISAKSL